MAWTSAEFDGLSYDVAIPVLTGWELSYGCDDAEVEEIGAWIGGFAYDPATSELSSDGLLAYTIRTVLHDQRGVDVQHSRYRVGVLGFRKMPPPPPAPRLFVVPDVLRFPFPDHLGRPATRRSALLSNYGNVPADRLRRRDRARCVRVPAGESAPTDPEPGARRG